jgi:dihydroorotate dehydrogenase (fumarate)
MIDLSTDYLGLHLKNPVVVSSSPLQREIDNIRKMEDAGAAAVVLHSLFEEQITLESEELDRSLNQGTESFAESLNYLPDLDKYNLGPEPYLEHIAKAKKSVGIPIIASVNGVSTGGWTRYAKMLGSMARRAVPNPSGFERSNYLKVLGSYAIEDADFVGDLAVKSSF